MSYERHDGLGFASAFASMPIAPQPTEEPSAPTGVRIPAAMMAAASMFSPTAQVTVPLNERRAFLRWYSNVQGPATGFRAVTAAPSSNPTHAELVAQAEAEEAARRKAGALRLFGSMRGLGGVSTDAAGVVTTTRGEYMRFKGARQRIGTLLAKGTIRVLTPLRRGFFNFWRKADKDGQAAYDSHVVSRAPARAERATELESGPRELVIWFNQQINTEAQQLGLSLERAMANVLRRGLPEGERARLLGFPAAAPADTGQTPTVGRLSFPFGGGGATEEQVVEDAVIVAMDAAAEVEQEQELPPPSDELPADEMPENGDLEVRQAGMLPFTLPWWGWVGVVGGVVGLSVFEQLRIVEKLHIDLITLIGKIVRIRVFILP